MEKFQYLIDNQSLWCQQYADQEKIKRAERLKTNKEKNWYGNSLEYKKEWDANNNRKVKSSHSHLQIHQNVHSPLSV